MSPKKINGHTLEEFKEFLSKTLIPDLLESGSVKTAKDFKSALKWFEYLGDVQNKFILEIKKGKK